MCVHVCAVPDGKFIKFSTGDMESLNRTGVHAALLDFHGAYYVASRMRLTVLGRQSLDELKDMVTRCGTGTALVALTCCCRRRSRFWRRSCRRFAVCDVVQRC